MPPPSISVRVTRSTLTSVFPYAGVRAFEPPLRGPAGVCVPVLPFARVCRLRREPLTPTCVCAFELLLRVCVCASTEIPLRVCLSSIMELYGSRRDTSEICRVSMPPPVDKLLHFMV